MQKMRRFAVIAGVLLWGLLPLCALNLWAGGKDVYLIKGDARSFTVPELEAVAIDNPSVADIISVGEDEIIIEAKNEGKTLLHITSQGIEDVMRVIVWPVDLNEKLAQIKLAIEQMGLSDKVQVALDSSAGWIIVSGELTEDAELNNFEKAIAPYRGQYLIERIKEPNATQPIEIKANIVEVAKGALESVGVQWPNTINVNDYDGTDVNSGTSFADMIRFNKWKRTDITWTLNMLEQNSLAKTIASPSITAISGKEASIKVGGEIPIYTVSDGDTEVEYKDYGVIMRIVPKIIGEDIDVALQVEVSDIDWENATTVSVAQSSNTNVTFQLPAFLNRVAQSQVRLKNGESIIIGGLIKNVSSKNLNKVPGLGRMPLLGSLFKSKRFQNDETELVITLTPYFAVPQKGLAEKPLNIPGTAQGHTFAKGDSMTVEERYKETVYDTFKSHFAIPEKIDIKGRKGTVVLLLKIEQTGEYKMIKVKSSSGDPILDRIAIQALNNVKKFPPIPASLNYKEIWVDLPVVFSGTD